MEARLHHYSRPGVLRVHAPAASPAPGPATADAQAADCAFNSLNGTVMTILALLVCGLVALLALYVVLSCALRATRRACHYDTDVDVDGHPHAGSRRGSGTGKKKKPRRSALVQALPCLAYFAGLDLAGSSRSECAICLAEFARGERVRVLPRCNHGFHARCIDRWLAARPTCPTCRQAPFAEDHTVLAQPEAHRVEQPAGAVQLLRARPTAWSSRRALCSCCVWWL